MNRELGALAMQSCLPPPPCFWGLILSSPESQFHSAFPFQPPHSRCYQPAPSLGSGMGRVRFGSVQPAASWGGVWQPQSLPSAGSIRGTFGGGLTLQGCPSAEDWSRDPAEDGDASLDVLSQACGTTVHPATGKEGSLTTRLEGECMPKSQGRDQHPEGLTSP